ncbi:hypothetical protein NC653_016382 [Populus alba x Populus x berolinensis]|uniref:Uncharacterized protein n=1 Tax=Populus alba x Populus x berolinensis TaxID=444605 RepID=A0AAD6VZ51_9ROSI|nr:hypothetical protein NC653_016382 [Populus alba x Populus x berolinensis]
MIIMTLGKMWTGMRMIPLPDFVLRVEGCANSTACMTVSVKLD